MRFRALVRKELLEAFRGFFWDQKTGKRRTPSRLMLFAVIYAAMFYMLVNMYSPMFESVASIWLPAGYDGSYFVYSIIISAVMSIFISLIIIYSSLFMARDNSVMLSLPIRPYEILLSRLCSVYVFNFVFSALAFITAFVHFARFASVTVMNVLTFAVSLFLLPAVHLCVSTLVGYLIGLVTGRMRHKQAGIMILTVLGAMTMSFSFGRISSSSVAELGMGSEPAFLVNLTRGSLNPLGLAARAFSGSPVSLLLFVLISVAFMAAVTAFVGRSLVRILGITEKQKKVKFRQSMIRSGGVKKALFARERRKVMSNAIYVLNCMFGSIMAIIGAVVLLIFSSRIREALGGFVLPVSLVSGIFCAAASMNDVTAPSVSTEGKSIWILNSLPVKTKEILLTKIRFHFIFTFVPYLLLHISFCIVFSLNVLQALFSLAVMALYILDVGYIGLFNDLKHGNTSYVNETVAIKQSMSVLFSLGEGILLAALMLVPSILLIGVVNGYLLSCAQILVLGVLLYLLSSWMNKKGSYLFMEM